MALKEQIKISTVFTSVTAKLSCMCLWVFQSHVKVDKKSYYLVYWFHVMQFRKLLMETTYDIIITHWQCKHSPSDFPFKAELFSYFVLWCSLVCRTNRPSFSLTELVSLKLLHFSLALDRKISYSSKTHNIAVTKAKAASLSTQFIWTQSVFVCVGLMLYSGRWPQMIETNQMWGVQQFP